MEREWRSEEYRSCRYIESGVVCFPNGITFCCYQKPPAFVQATEDAVNVINNFLDTRERIIRENQSDNPPCGWCPIFQKCQKESGKIDYFNFSTHCYCQLSCIYCTLQGGGQLKKNKAEDYNSIEIAQELKSRNLLAEKLHIDCAPGEIAIHPNRSAYYDFIEENAYSVAFYTNAVKYDERLAGILKASPRNRAIVSMDSGTAETFRVVKGLDVFDKVVSNLHEYRRNSTQLILKYILLDANCNKADVTGFIELCKDLNVAKIDISADLYRKTDYMNAAEPEEHIVNSAVQLICGAIKYRIKFSIYRKAFGAANLAEICKRLLDLPEFALDLEKFESVFSAQKLICYGAGKNACVMLQQMKSLDMREPDVFWDRKAEDEESDSCRKIRDLGYTVSSPMFTTLDSEQDAVIISIMDEKINAELIHDMRMRGFERVISWKDFAWIFMMERFRKHGVEYLGW